MSDGVQVQKSSRIVREQWFYDDMFFEADERSGPILWVRHFVEYVTKAGKVHRRYATSPIELADIDAIEAWIEEHHASESDDPEGEDRDWTPDEWGRAQRTIFGTPVRSKRRRNKDDPKRRTDRVLSQ